MDLKKAVNILENMCYRYGKPRQKGRTEKQIKEIEALNVVLGTFRKEGQIKWID
mgnify:FL=1